MNPLQACGKNQVHRIVAIDQGPFLRVYPEQTETLTRSKNMVTETEFFLTLVMGGISVFLIRTILVIRNRRFRFASEGQDDYSGDAKNPDSLSNPDSDALEDMDYLMDRAGFSILEEE